MIQVNNTVELFLTLMEIFIFEKRRRQPASEY